MKRRPKLNDNNFRCSWDIFIFAIAISVLAVILLKRCRYGFGNIDESFYLTIPYRLVRGDGLLDTEWHLSQLSGVLLMPAMRLFLTISNGTEGIILAFRYIFVAVQIIAAVIVFICMRKESRSGAIISGILLAAYAPFGIPALSYNSMGIVFLSLAMVLLFSSKNRLVQCISGMLYSAAVLCCPYLAVLILIYYAAFLAARRADNAIASELTEKKKILSFTVGILISAAAFFVFLLSRSSISGIIESLPFIMIDPEHQSSISNKIIQFLLCIVYSCPRPWIFPIFALLFVTGFAVIAQGTGEIYSRLVDVFWDSPVSTQTVPVETGPEKGLLVTQEKRDMYYSTLDNLRMIDEDTEKILFLSNNTWLYLCGDWEMCTYSAWLSGVDDTTTERLHAYYDINKQKTPDCVYIEKDYLAYADEFTENYGFTEMGYTPGGDLILIR